MSWMYVIGAEQRDVFPAASVAFAVKVVVEFELTVTWTEYVPSAAAVVIMLTAPPHAASA